MITGRPPVFWIAVLVAILLPALLYMLFRPAPEGLRIEPMAVTDLPGWQADDLTGALAAFRKTCAMVPGEADLSPPPDLALARGWDSLCQQAQSQSTSEGRSFFEEHFTALKLSFDGEEEGLLTGYYEPLLQGSLEPGPDYPVPLYARPPELVTVDLGRFREDLAGRRIAGSVRNGRLQPYYSRGDIEQGALEGRDLEIVWVRDPVKAFFLHIQGSGRVELADGRHIRMGYAGPNGHVYTSLGQVMAERGLIARDDISLQSIQAWLRANPADAIALMRENASFIFFRILDGDGPVGTAGVALTPERSLAVDRRYIPMGMPVWIDGTRPALEGEGEEPVPFRRLMVAQDTGGAIAGPLRGDVFWGFGERAEAIAGNMANRASFYVLVPRGTAGEITERLQQE